jgi:hypothetical protein
MSATTFSPASQFNNGQYVTAVEQTGIAVGWMRGASGKLVAVKFTSGPKKGKILGVRPARVVPRKGRKGSGTLPRIS